MSETTETLELFAHHFQFYLQDDHIDVGNLADAWGPDSDRLRIAIGPRVLGVATARNRKVPVEVALLAAAPALDTKPWAHVVDADLEVQTGRIVFAGCTDDYPEAKRFEVSPGNYRVRVLFRMEREADDDDPGDHLLYRVELWPSSQSRPVEVLKQGPVPWAY